MRSFAYALPVKDRAAGMRLVDALAGEHAEKYHASRKNQGFQRIKVFLQDKPHEMVVIYVEGAGPQVHEHIQTRHAADDAMEKWFEDELEKVTGHRISQLTGSTLPSELILDWHPEHGVSRTHHKV